MANPEIRGKTILSIFHDSRNENTAMIVSIAENGCAIHVPPIVIMKGEKTKRSIE